MTLDFDLRVRNASLGEYLGIVSNPIGMLTKPNKGVMNGLQYHPQSTYHRRPSVSMAPCLANVTTRSNTNKQHHTTQANNTLSTHSSKHVCDPRHVSNVCKQCCFYNQGLWLCELFAFSGGALLLVYQYSEQVFIPPTRLTRSVFYTLQLDLVMNDGRASIEHCFETCCSFFTPAFERA